MRIIIKCYTSDSFIDNPLLNTKHNLSNTRVLLLLSHSTWYNIYTDRIADKAFPVGLIKFIKGLSFQ